MIASSLALHAGMASVLGHIAVESPRRVATSALDDEIVFDLSIRSTVLRRSTELVENVAPIAPSEPTVPPEVALALAWMPVESSATEAPVVDAMLPVEDVDPHHVEPEASAVLASDEDVVALGLGAAPVDAPEGAAFDATAPAARALEANSVPAPPLNVTATMADAAATTLAPASTSESAATTTDTEPASEDNPAPHYPRDARKRGWQGTVLLRVDVSAQGRTTAVEIAQSSGHRVLDDAARDAVRDWRFRPARRAGAAVPGRVEIPITFRLQTAR